MSSVTCLQAKTCHLHFRRYLPSSQNFAFTFSSLLAIKPNARNRLDEIHDMRKRNQTQLNW